MGHLMNIKEYVYNYRKEHSLSMQAFANMCGLSRAYISILEKGINPTTGKPFIPTIDTLKKIAEITGTDLDSLLKMLDDSQQGIANVPPIPILHLTVQEEAHIKKYRQLNGNGKLVIDNLIDFMLYHQGLSAKKEEWNL
jgi:transcriptional regulator with XRE-family HTH domain